MAVLEAGQDIALIEPTLYWSWRHEGILPNIDQPLGDPWPDGWTKIYDTVNGIQVTHRNPQVAIQSEERDRIASVKGQGQGTAVAFQAITFTDEFWMFANNMSTMLVSAASIVVSFRFATGASGDGNVGVILPGLALVNVPVTSAAQSSPTLVATAVRAASFTGWTTGGTGDEVTFTKTTSGNVSGAASLVPGATGVTTVATYPKVTTEGHKEFTSAWVDSDEEHTIAVGFEGLALAGGPFAVDTKVRGFAYRLENTQNGVDVFRRTGADSIIRPNMVLEALPEQIQDTQLQGSGIPRSAIDPRGRFNYFRQAEEAA
jgi:hypothetical protein